MAHQQMFHLVGSGIRTSNHSVTGPTLLTARLPAALLPLCGVEASKRHPITNLSWTNQLEASMIRIILCALNLC